MDIAVITTRNEEDTIAPLVRSLRARGLRAVVVDEYSEDDTVRRALTAGATIVMPPEGVRGIGPSLLEGWKKALAMGATRIVQVDAGGSHDPADVAGLLEAAETAEVVIGSRFCPGARHTGNRKRALFSRLAALACNLAQPGARHSDWTSGYRVFSADAARRLLAQRYTARQHGWQIQVLAHAGALGLRIAEVPIRYRAGRSSFNRRVAWEAFMVWWDMFHHAGRVSA